MKHKLIIIGSGGHARSVIDAAVSEDKYDIVGCISSEPVGKDVAYNVKVVGDDSYLDKLLKDGIYYAFIAIGNNTVRKRIFNSMLQMGFKFANIISPSAVVSPTCRLGEGVCVLHGAILNVNVIIGNNTIINTKASLDHDCIIGSHCHIAPGVTMSGTVSVGDGTHIGTGSSVIDNIKIGSMSYAGAGSVIVNNIDDCVLVYGVPARKIKSIDSEKI